MALTRRGFLGRVAAGASGVVGASLFPNISAGAVMPTQIGLIGCGERGSSLARELSRESRSLIALYDAVPARAEALAREVNANTVHAWQALVDSPNIGALIIATPDDTHLPMAHAAIAAGKHVYLEMPAVGPHDNLRALVEEDHENRIQFGIDDPLLCSLIEFWDFRVYGPIRHAQFHDRANTRNANLHAPEWQCDPERSFGPAASRVYTKALAYLVAGSTSALCDATVQHDGGSGRVPEHVVLSLHNVDGSTAVFSAAPHATAPQADIVRYAKGCVEFLGGGHYRYTDELGRMESIAREPTLANVPESMLLPWQYYIANHGKAFIPLDQSLKIHDAFAKALA